MIENYEIYRAPKGKVYVHKNEQIKLFGEVVFVSPDDPYTIDDFKLIDENELQNYKDQEGGQ